MTMTTMTMTMMFEDCRPTIARQRGATTATATVKSTTRRRTFQSNKIMRASFLLHTLFLLACLVLSVHSFTAKISVTTRPALPRRLSRALHQSALPQETTEISNAIKMTTNSSETDEDKEDSTSSSLLRKLQDKMGKVDESRFLHDQHSSPRMFSTLRYRYAPDETSEDQQQQQQQANQQLEASHQAGSVPAAAALVAGTTIGAGILALPQATAAVGLVPSSAALTGAWVYMTMSGLLYAELALNQLLETGKPHQLHSILDFFDGSSTTRASQVTAVASFFFLQYAVLIALVAQATDMIMATSSLAAHVPAAVGVTAAVGTALAVVPQEKLNQATSLASIALLGTFGIIVSQAAPTMDWNALVASANQHPEKVLDCLPVIFVSLVFQPVVPTIVRQLEADRTKIIQAIVAGTTLPFLVYLTWNALVLGNTDTDMLMDHSNPVAAFAEQVPLVQAFAALSIATSVFGVADSLTEGWAFLWKKTTLSVNRSSSSQGEPPAGGLSTPSSPPPPPAWATLPLVLAPPAFIAATTTDAHGLFQNTLEWAGAFGVSTLFLVLAPIVVWRQRYSEESKETQPWITRPMVPFGKIPLGSLYKAAGTLILEQGLEKLGVLEFVRQHLPS